MSALCVSSLTHYQAVRFAGKDVRTFLQGQTSTDITDCTNNAFRPCYFCQYQGKVVANGYVLVFSPTYALLLCHNSIADGLISYLAPYAQLSGIELGTMPFTYYGLIYSKATENLPKPLYYQLFDDFIVATVATGLSLAFGDKRPIDLWLAKQNYLTNTDASQWHLQSMQQSICILPENMSLKFTPNMLADVPSAAISVTKGCYTGQEVIARTYHLGKPKRSLYTLFTQSYLYRIADGTRLQIADTNAHADVVASYCCAHTLWLQVVMPLHARNEVEFILRPEEHPDNVVAFTATKYTD